MVVVTGMGGGGGGGGGGGVQPMPAQKFKIQKKGTCIVQGLRNYKSVHM